MARSDPEPRDPRRALPGVDRLAEAIRAAAPKLPGWAARAAARAVVDAARGELERDGTQPSDLVGRGVASATLLARPRPTPVVNATGVVLHTNLGRAPLSTAAASAAAEAGRRYTDLELDEGRGRGDRVAALGEKLVALSGAQAALAVNNNAGALLLAAHALARGREVVVSRGELVEIGGSFRLPAILDAAGVTLVEVGTTNRTHAEDYRRALGPQTALLLKVHRSNFEQRGYVAEVDVRELAGIARPRGIPLLEDLGSATLVDLRARGLPEESWAPARLRLGADLVCFSGDKLLGGPQAGVVLGRRDLVTAMRRDPLARALRLDKLAIAALDTTLATLLEGDPARELPVLRALLEPAAAVEARARRLAARLEPLASGSVKVAVEPTRAPVGGGSLPGFELDSWAVVLRPERDADGLADSLRDAPVPVLGRVREAAVWLDARTLLSEDEAAVAASLAHVLADGAR